MNNFKKRKDYVEFINFCRKYDLEPDKEGNQHFFKGRNKLIEKGTITPVSLERVLNESISMLHPNLNEINKLKKCFNKIKNKYGYPNNITTMEKIKKPKKHEKEKKEIEEFFSFHERGLYEDISKNLQIHADKIEITKNNDDKKDLHDKYPITNAHWEGTYFEWYEYFILPTYRNAFPLGEIHRKWGEEIESDDLLIELKPRDHYKTSFFSIGYAVYNLVENRLFPVLIVSKAEMNTKDTFAAIKEHLEKNERILEYYGYIIDDTRTYTSQLLYTKYQTVGAKDPALFCATFGSRHIMGTHPLLAILDDIEEEPLSPAYMRQAKKLLDKSLISGMPVGSKLIIVGTIKGWDHTNDIYLYAAKKGVFSLYKDPAVYLVDKETKQPILDEKGNKIYGLPPMNHVKVERKRVPAIDPRTGKQLKTLDGKLKTKLDVVIELDEEEKGRWMSIYPERYTVEDIIKKRILTREVDKDSDDTFWSEFFLEPRDPKGNFFEMDCVGKMPPPGFTNVESFISYLKENHALSYAWVDPGGKKGHGIAVAVVFFYDDKIYVVDTFVIRKGIPATAKLIGDLIIKYNITQWGCESNYSQKETFGDTLERELKRYLKSINREKYFLKNMGAHNTGDKIVRIMTHMTQMIGTSPERKQFYINPLSEGYELLEKELNTFPDQSLGGDFDILDCISSIKIHLYRNYGEVVFSIGYIV